MPTLLTCLATLGHFAVSCIVINRLHATSLPERFRQVINFFWIIWILGAPAAAAAWLWAESQGLFHSWHDSQYRLLILTYLMFCFAAAAYIIPSWAWRRLTEGINPGVESNHTEILDVSVGLGYRPAGSMLTKVVSYIPWNQILELHVHKKHVHLPRLPDELVGLTITHISDLHFTGQLKQSFFDFAVDKSNELDSDLVLITGDIIDKLKCLPWIEETLGRLQSRYGTYFVLGNHDWRLPDVSVVRKCMTDVGHVDLGGKWTRLNINGHPIVLAGNELPWFLPEADMGNCPDKFDGKRALRILLSHAPDQIDWAQYFNIDLMLAGHTHGGQFRLPLIGPVVSPSRFGVRYCSGTFYLKPTLLHVSRGISATRQLRLNCPPELTQLILTNGEIHT